MKLNDYKNIEEVFSTKETLLSQFTDIESRSIDFYTEVIPELVKVDCAIYDFDSGELVDYININDETSPIIVYTNHVEIPEGTLSKILSDNNLYGNYVGVFHFYKTFFPSNVSMYLDEISTSRNEIRLKFSNTNDASIVDSILTGAVNPNIIVDFLNDIRVLCVSHEVDKNSFSVASLIFKIYEDYTLPNNLNNGDSCEVLLSVADSYFEISSLPFPQDSENFDKELFPNFSIDVKQSTKSTLDYKSYNDLIVTSSFETKILKEIKETRFNLDIDYSDYTNFIHYSSAETRVDNFRDKIVKIEQYSSDITTLLSLTQSANVSESLSVARIKRDDIISNFDGYEKFLYYYSGSLYEDEYTNATYSMEWPKSTNTKPYNLYSYTSSQVSNWYISQSLLAREYDLRNSNYILYAIPDAIRNDDNKDYLTFVKMIGQAFDNIKLYVDSFSKRNIFNSGWGDGVPKDASWYLAKQVGVNLPTIGDSKNLSEYLLGYSSSLEYITSSLNDNTIKENVQKLWKRILSNVPYILKSKGTERSIRAIFNSFGIPKDLYTIKEYGGPDISFKEYNFENISETKLVKDSKFLSLAFSGEQNIEFPWSDYNSKKADSVEFRFKSTYGASPYDTQVLVESLNKWAIVIQKTGSLYSGNTGIIKFILSSSDGYISSSTSEIPVFDTTTYWSVLLARQTSSNDNDIAQDFNLYVQKYDFDRFTHKVQSSLILSGPESSSANGAYNIDNILYLGGSSTSSASPSIFGAPVSGTIDDFRLWSVPLKEYVFDFHTQAPSAYIGNTISSSFVDLVLWYRLDENKDLSADDTIIDSNYTATSITATASNFSGNNYTYYEEQEYIPVPDVTTIRPVNNKVRIETNYISGSALYFNKSVESSSFDRYGFDSSKFTIDFSLTDIINTDIIKSFAIFIDDYIADPSYRSDSEYKNLQKITRLYLSKFEKLPNINSFIKNISKALETTKVFEMIKDTIPARIKNPLAIGVENTILDRGKIKSEEVSSEYQQLEDSMSFSEISFNNSYDVYESVINAQDEYTFDSAYSFLEASIPLVYEGASGSVIQPFLPYFYVETGSKITNPLNVNHPLILVKQYGTGSAEWYKCFAEDNYKRNRQYAGTIGRGPTYNDGKVSGSNYPNGTEGVIITKIQIKVPIAIDNTPSTLPRLRADDVPPETRPGGGPSAGGGGGSS